MGDDVINFGPGALYIDDQRVRHLMIYGKTKRIQLKNFKRAFKKIVGSSIHEWTD